MTSEADHDRGRLMVKRIIVWIITWAIMQRAPMVKHVCIAVACCMQHSLPV